MSLDTAKSCIDWIFNNIPEYASGGVEVAFIGGEPLLEFELIKKIFEYTTKKYLNIPKIFFATTNGTCLTNEMKEWFTAHKQCFWLGLSLDGTRETHNHNRSNSFDSIDFDFFLKNWNLQEIKMTISEYSLSRLAKNIKFVHSLGFNNIGGVNLAEGCFDWEGDEHIRTLIPQLSELVDFYVKNDNIQVNKMLDKHLGLCQVKNNNQQKWCGIGKNVTFFDTDGKRYPCPYITPMTFSKNDLNILANADYDNDENFLDDCSSSCYIYPLCPTCYGANYHHNKSFKVRNKTRCRIQKLIALFSADLHAKRIAKNSTPYEERGIYDTIEAIKKIKLLYLSEFEKFFTTALP